MRNYENCNNIKKLLAWLLRRFSYEFLIGIISIKRFTLQFMKILQNFSTNLIVLAAPFVFIIDKIDAKSFTYWRIILNSNCSDFMSCDLRIFYDYLLKMGESE